MTAYHDDNRRATGAAASGGSRGYDARKVKLFTLWEKTAASGKKYMQGFWGDLSIVAFAHEIEHPKTGEPVTEWRVLAEEKDPTRRPGSADRGR